MEINNKKAYFDYQILEEIEAGIVLTGTEIKSIRNGQANLKDSYAIIRNNEVFILNMHISKYNKTIYMRIYPLAILHTTHFIMKTKTS